MQPRSIIRSRTFLFPSCRARTSKHACGSIPHASHEERRRRRVGRKRHPSRGRHRRTPLRAAGANGTRTFLSFRSRSNATREFRTSPNLRCLPSRRHPLRVGFDPTLPLSVGRHRLETEGETRGNRRGVEDRGDPQMHPFSPTHNHTPLVCGRGEGGSVRGAQGIVGVLEADFGRETWIHPLARTRVLVSPRVGAAKEGERR